MACRSRNRQSERDGFSANLLLAEGGGGGGREASANRFVEYRVNCRDVLSKFGGQLGQGGVHGHSGRDTPLLCQGL